MAFRRYTNLAATIHLLRTRKITLLNPGTWDDKNDAYFMAEYKRHKGAKTLLALCFAETSETYHHWRVFSHGSDGVCIEFEKEKLLAIVRKDSKVKVGYVTYTIIRKAPVTIDREKLPFLKRQPYRDEREFRVLYVDTAQSSEIKEYQIDIKCIRRITLSPWMSPALADSVKACLKGIKGCTNVPIVRSTLVENEEWKALTSRVVSRS